MSDTPKTDALLIDAKTGRTIIVGETFGRLEVLCRELERELGAQKKPCTDEKEQEHGCYRAVKAENELAAYENVKGMPEYPRTLHHDEGRVVLQEHYDTLRTLLAKQTVDAGECCVCRIERKG